MMPLAAAECGKKHRQLGVDIYIYIYITGINLPAITNMFVNQHIVNAGVDAL